MNEVGKKKEQFLVTMDFDSMGRRTFYRETENDVLVSSSRFFYDGYLMIQQLDHDSPYAVQKEFIWDPTEPVATKPLVFRQNGMDSTYLTHDGNKNVADVIRAVQYNDSVGHYEYAPFGAVTSSVGSRAADTPFRFSSEYADDILGLVYYNYRHYDVSLGKWLCFDRIDDALNPNSMLENRPPYAFDYLGLKICYRWMLITFYTGQKGPSRNSWNKNDLTEMDAAVGLAGWTYENGRAKKGSTANCRKRVAA